MAYSLSFYWHRELRMIKVYGVKTMQKIAKLLPDKRLGGWVFNRWHDGKSLKSIMLDMPQKQTIRYMRKEGYKVRFVCEVSIKKRYG